MGKVEPSSRRRPCSSGPLNPGIRTSRRTQPSSLSLGKFPRKFWLTDSSRLRSQPASNDVRLPPGTQHRRQRRTQTPRVFPIAIFIPPQMYPYQTCAERVGIPVCLIFTNGKQGDECSHTENDSGEPDRFDDENPPWVKWHSPFQMPRRANRRSCVVRRCGGSARKTGLALAPPTVIRCMNSAAST